jgi:NTP pyrophosphatase (non-canonical NTP hydrolase)
MSFEIIEDLENKVVSWGYSRGILTGEEPTTHRRIQQLVKTEEEVSELADAIHSGDKEEAIDAIGDILVTLIMQTSLWDTNLHECLDQAFEVINTRTGRMADGIFVKDE